MYHSDSTSRKRVVIALATSAIVTLLGSAAARAQDATACKQAIAVQAATLEGTKMSLLQTCEDAKRNGTLPKSKASKDCVTINATKIKSAIKNAQKAVQKACCSSKKSCLSLAAIGWAGDGSTGNPVLAKACSGGDRPGEPCVRETECPGQCIGGAKNEESCTFNSSCADHACVKGNCVGGKNDGKPCTSRLTEKTECPGGTCPNLEAGSPPGAGNIGSCNGGSNDQGGCSADSDCPGGGVCDGGCNTGNLLDSVSGYCDQPLCSSNKDCGLCALKVGSSAVPFGNQSCASDTDCGKVCNDTGKSCKTAGDCPTGTCGVIAGACTVGTCSNGFCTSGDPHARSSAGLCHAAPRCPNFKNNSLPGFTCNGGNHNGQACTKDANCGKGFKCQAGCDFPLTSAIDVASCITCIGDGATTQLDSLFYGDLTAKTSDTSLEACKSAVAKAGATFFEAKRQALAACEAGVLAGSSPGPCPDAATTTIINTANQKLHADITAGCPSNPTADQIAKIYTCPALTVPGASASCAGVTNRGPVSSLSDLADCIACVAEYNVDCTDRLAAPATGALFSQCNALCGNGKIDGSCSNNASQLCGSSLDCPGGSCIPFETCDDGNAESGDDCPANCSIATCKPSGGNKTISVTVSAPAGVQLGALSVFVEYPDGVVGIPGRGPLTDATRFTADASIFLTANDLDYAVRVALVSTSTQIPSTAFSVTTDTCSGAAAPTVDEFSCHIESASDINQNVVSGVTCAVSLQ